MARRGIRGDRLDTRDETSARYRAAKARDAEASRRLTSKRPVSLCSAGLPGCEVEAHGGRCCEACRELARRHGGAAQYKRSVLRVPCL
jgi:hypothetical protein